MWAESPLERSLTSLWLRFELSFTFDLFNKCKSQEAAGKEIGLYYSVWGWGGSRLGKVPVHCYLALELDYSDLQEQWLSG